METSSSDGRQHGGAQEQQAPHGQSEEGGHSGEGAASALAHLKSQARQHRHHTGDGEDAAQGHAQ